MRTRGCTVFGDLEPAARIGRDIGGVVIVMGFRAQTSEHAEIVAEGPSRLAPEGQHARVDLIVIMRAHREAWIAGIEFEGIRLSLDQKP